MTKQNNDSKSGIRTHINKKTTIGLFSLILAAAVVSIAVYEINNNDIQAQANSESRVAPIDVQWVGYPQLDNLTNSSDAIVIGKIITDKGEIAGLLPQTDFNVNIEQVLKGNFKPGDNVIVRQVGSRSPTGALDTDVMMNVGDRYLFFLGYSHTTTDVYYSLGGPQGRYLIQNGMVNSMDQVDPKADFVHVKEKNKPINDFITEISSKMKEVQNK